MTKRIVKITMALLQCISCLGRGGLLIVHISESLPSIAALLFNLHYDKDDIRPTRVVGLVQQNICGVPVNF